MDEEGQEEGQEERRRQQQEDGEDSSRGGAGGDTGGVCAREAEKAGKVGEEVLAREAAAKDKEAAQEELTSSFLRLALSPGERKRLLLENVAESGYLKPLRCTRLAELATRMGLMHSFCGPRTISLKKSRSTQMVSHSPSFWLG